MFSYELQQTRRDDLQRQAEEWRLARDAKAARSAERRARRTQARAAVRTDAEGAGATLATPAAAAAGHRGTGRFHRALHPHSAA
ncbi:hypothetical protein [Actinacidiphila acidipaludis]|uniref:Uncharacterized protein n=1 Tax=Actinacidiphila acidipaludis TaxID=2873382 RepID=A0ABS7QI62_9ACTN|nr:hypothetical protein [Streptomyces acidipaludis]MBY8882860.1 hypothetical protein [Streptomyces acidipaludis]